MIAGTAAAILAAVLLVSMPVQAVSAQKAILVDAQTKRVLFSKLSDARALIASTTKIMTALIVCQQCNVLDRMRIPKEAVGIEGSSIYLQEGEILTIQDLLYGLMLHSGNDAAVALAIYCGGTVEAFTELMNDKARELGMCRSHFVNPNGLDHPDHYSTAADMAILASYAMNNPVFAQIVSTKSVTIGNRVLRNHNKLLWQVPYVDGIKTGYTKAAGRILVSSATQSGRRLVAVTINAPDDWNDHKKLLMQGFSDFEDTVIVSKGDCLGQIEVEGSKEKFVELICDETFSYPLAKNETTSVKLPEPQFVYAPVAEGQKAGCAHVCVDGVPVGKVQMVYGQTAEVAPKERKSLWLRIFERK